MLWYASYKQGYRDTYPYRGLMWIEVIQGPSRKTGTVPWLLPTRPPKDCSIFDDNVISLSITIVWSSSFKITKPPLLHCHLVYLPITCTAPKWECLNLPWVGRASPTYFLEVVCGACLKCTLKIDMNREGLPYLIYDICSNLQFTRLCYLYDCGEELCHATWTPMACSPLPCLW